MPRVRATKLFHTPRAPARRPPERSTGSERAHQAAQSPPVILTSPTAILGDGRDPADDDDWDETKIYNTGIAADQAVKTAHAAGRSTYGGDPHDRGRGGYWKMRENVEQKLGHVPGSVHYGLVGPQRDDQETHARDGYDTANVDAVTGREMYGKVQLHMKPSEVPSDTTITYGDSLAEGGDTLLGRLSDVRSPDWEGVPASPFFGRRNSLNSGTAPRYYEAQIPARHAPSFAPEQGSTPLSSFSHAQFRKRDMDRGAEEGDYSYANARSALDDAGLPTHHEVENVYTQHPLFAPNDATQVTIDRGRDWPAVDKRNGRSYWDKGAGEYRRPGSG